MEKAYRRFLIIFGLLLAVVLPAEGLEQRARYKVSLPEKTHDKQVASVEMAISAAAEKADCHWYRVTGTKVNGQSYTFWILAEGNLLTVDESEKILCHRYILQEPGEKPVEYVDEFAGKALMPLLFFTEELLPRGAGSFPFAKGKYLGFPIDLEERLKPIKVNPPTEVLRLEFRTDLLVGTSRNFRDDGQGRKSRKDNYNFIRFTKENYDEMITAGINYFVLRGEQINMVCRRAAFYEGYDPAPVYPEELYRSNFLGVRMFLDEPACRLAGKYPPEAPLSQAVEMIHEHIREKLGQSTLRNIFTQRGIDPGTMQLMEPQIPIWETYVGTSFYQMEANPYGLVQECRWRIDPATDSPQILMLQKINEEFGVEIPITPENLFLWFYSQMRGPAQALGTKWGMSIYGQAEEKLRWPSMKLAYDMGAEYVWFWTSDHDHHVSYTEQLKLARRLAVYAEQQPKRDLEKLRQTATTAIVLPYGYTLPTQWQLHTWGTHIYPLKRKNQFGLTYKQVLKPAIQEITRCLKGGIFYDVLPAGKAFRPGEYETVIWIRENGRVEK
jgi:hypothetical protein